MRVLLVDDEESLRVTLAGNLELEGHDVLEASNGHEALEVLRNAEVDLVLSDIRMPGLGGVELLQHVRRSHPHLPVLLMTAYTADDQMDTALMAGVFAVLRKPFDPESAIRLMARAARSPVVLVVDDDRSVSTSLAEALSMAGLRAEAVFSGAEALASVASGRVDVCVTDVIMPEMDGPTLVDQLRAKWPKLAVIVFSGCDPRELLERFSGVGITGCLKKPVHPRDLLRSVARARGGTWGT
ncbi:MAG TPA: response regulator [Polyangiaceae bacterium]|nr:response regulator [Polyangiaceae bacterium]